MCKSKKYFSGQVKALLRCPEKGLLQSPKWKKMRIGFKLLLSRK